MAMTDGSKMILWLDATGSEAPGPVLFDGHQYTVQVLDSDQAVLAHCDARGPGAVVVAPLHPAGGDGLALLRTLRHRWPDMVGILLAPAEDATRGIEALHEGIAHRCVQLPPRPNELDTALRDALGFRALSCNERRLREQLARINAELDDRLRDLDEANELLEYWVEFSPAVLFSMSCEAGHLHPSYVSKNFYRLTGFERTAAVVEADFWEGLIHPGDAPRYRETLRALAGPERNFAVLEYRVRHRDGTYLTVVDSMRAVRDGEGQTIEIVGARLDVSARA